MAAIESYALTRESNAVRDVSIMPRWAIQFVLRRVHHYRMRRLIQDFMTGSKKTQIRIKFISWHDFDFIISIKFNKSWEKIY